MKVGVEIFGFAGSNMLEVGIGILASAQYFFTRLAADESALNVRGGFVGTSLRTLLARSSP